jgi:sugar lactone lactonase YvrE
MKMPFFFGVAALALLAAGCANNSATSNSTNVSVTTNLPPPPPPAAAKTATPVAVPAAVANNPAAGAPATAGSASAWDSAKPVAATLAEPRSIAVDGAGNLYVASVGDSTIHKISASGADVILAAPAEGYATPCGVAVDGAGNVYVANTDDETICKITTDGGCSVLAGMSGNSGSTDGTGGAARFSTPTSVAVDGAGNVYVADNADSTVRKITPDGVVTTLAGKAGSIGRNDGTGADAQFNSPRGITADAAGNVYVADEGSANIRKITPQGVVTTLAGVAAKPGDTDGAGAEARFGSPRGLTVDAAGNVFVADTDNNLVRKIAPDGTVSTVAGSAGKTGDSDGTGSEASFSAPRGIAVDAAGNVFVADSDNNSIRMVTPAGVVTTVVKGAP